MVNSSPAAQAAATSGTGRPSRAGSRSARRRALPEDCAGGTQGDARGVMSLGAEGYESLYDALCHVRDTRDSNRTFPIGGLLAIVVMAMIT